jgi:hypothetical protein
MRKILPLLLTTIFLNGISQISEFTFEGVKDYDNGYRIAYFHLAGISDDAQAYYLQKQLLTDNKVKRFIIYKGNTQNRRGMIECKSELNETKIKNKLNNIISTYENLKNESPNLREFYLKIFEINNMPKYINTGNRKEDVLKFKDKFETWKQNNPEKYNLIRNIQLDIFIQ